MSIGLRHISPENTEKVNRILEVVIAYARLDFRQKTLINGDDEILDAIGAGVNMLGEELENSTISLKEKEQLLKEVHHRVKNNLQIVSSLLKLQSENIFDQKYLDLIADSRNRINSMALVHEMLYSSTDLGRIEIGAYIRRLTGFIEKSLSKPGSGILLNFDIREDLFFDIDTMIPLGLVITEIVSNAIKHAFPENKGQINISIQSSPEGSYKLTIADNGVGFPADFNPKKDGNLGIQLIHMLTEQLEGSVTTGMDSGATYHIIFNDGKGKYPHR